MAIGRGITPKMIQMLANIKSYLINSWAVGLPELTQRDGATCNDSCANQAWSVAAILDILYDHSHYSHEEVSKWTNEVPSDSSE